MVASSRLFSLSVAFSALGSSTVMAGLTGGAGGNWYWSLCDPEFPYPVSIDSLKVEPDTVVIGGPFDIVYGLSTSVVINYGAYLNGEFFSNGAEVGSIAGVSLCSSEIVNITGVECPIPVGPFGLELSSSIPGDVPPGEYSSHIEFFNDDDQILLCTDTTVDLS
ncbi:hypothetical protein NM688_g7589 [Phlebia brevispora]|uniref:Uncharacterized protein n=1 Tax=Phlebia brevispora TaxID=194682 RepID=A0ACC1S3K0_9APHY|nr:hypothetical protein NM688_g7589 [Phlebia brevispora]